MSEEAKGFLAEKGWDPVYGARPLKRAIQKNVLDPLAMEVLQGKFHQLLREFNRAGILPDLGLTMELRQQGPEADQYLVLVVTAPTPPWYVPRW